MEIRRLGHGDGEAVLAAAPLFDMPPRREWVDRFLASAGHHLFIAYVDGSPAGFVSGMEITHPDKGTEMLLYELGVDAGFRRRGVGSSLAAALRDLAVQQGCRGMWVPIEPADAPAIATYRAAGATRPEAAAIMEWDLG